MYNLALRMLYVPYLWRRLIFTGCFFQDHAVQYWLSEGAPADKLLAGIPFYGITFTLANITEQDVGAPHEGGGDLAYYEVRTRQTRPPDSLNHSICNLF